MLILILGIVLLIAGIVYVYRARISKEFYIHFKNEKIQDFQKAVGTVIGDAYPADYESKIPKPVTPIVEYMVYSEKYETQNPVLEMNAELPVGTRVYVWYKKDNPSQAILGAEVESHSFQVMFGMLMIAFGVIFLLLGI